MSHELRFGYIGRGSTSKVAYKKISISTDAPSITMDPIALSLIVQGVEKGRVTELVRPFETISFHIRIQVHLGEVVGIATEMEGSLTRTNHRRWPHQESSCKTSEANPNELRTQGEQNLETPTEIYIIEWLPLKG